jgi:hypothetical protein
MGAHVELNGVRLGTATDQFLRYTFDVGHLLRPSGNQLRLIFEISAIDTGGRFMTATGGYDWAPWATTWKVSPSVNDSVSGGFGGGAQATFSFGCWKSVYVVSVPRASAAITAVTTETFYSGDYPTAPLTDATHAGFELRLTVQLRAATRLLAGSTMLSASASFGNASQTLSAVPAGVSDMTLTLVVPAGGARLWWPAGLGAQALYNVTIELTSATDTVNTGDTAAVVPAGVRTTRQVGFRSIALVTSNDTNPTVRAASATHDGSGGATMFLRINGAAVWSRGGNKVPMEELEGRLDGQAHRQLVRSAADAGFTMLRVWGGGIYEPDAFYDAADEFGILVYHDLQFAVSNVDLREIVHELYNYSATYQNYSKIMRAETEFQVKRLSHHPCIAIIDGCNECGGHGLGLQPDADWAKHDVPIQIAASVDASRPVWPSCPSSGWVSGGE